MNEIEQHEDIYEQLSRPKRWSEELLDQGAQGVRERAARKQKRLEEERQRNKALVDKLRQPKDWGTI